VNSEELELQPEADPVLSSLYRLVALFGHQITGAGCPLLGDFVEKLGC
jgi:hypothetical protein